MKSLKFVIMLSAILLSGTKNASAANLPIGVYQAFGGYDAAWLTIFGGEALSRKIVKALSTAGAKHNAKQKARRKCRSQHQRLRTFNVKVRCYRVKDGPWLDYQIHQDCVAEGTFTCR